MIGLLAGICLSISSFVFAHNGLEVSLFPVKYYFNNQSKDLPNEFTTFNYNGHVYVP